MQSFIFWRAAALKNLRIRIVENNRPIFLNLMQIKFPITAITSILHRISGVIIFIFIPFVLYMLHQSLESVTTFNNLMAHESGVFWRLMVWLLLISVIYHILAGFRHLAMDCGFADSMRAATVTSWILILLAIAFIILTGFWVW